MVLTVPELAARIEQPTALRILHHLPMMLTTNTWERLDQRALAHLLRRSQPTISQAMAALMKAGAVARTGRGPGVRYQLARSVAWELPPLPKALMGAFHNGPYVPETGNVSGVTADDLVAEARAHMEAARAELEGAVRQHQVNVKGKAPLRDRRRSKNQVEEAEARMRAAVRALYAAKQEARQRRA